MSETKKLGRPRKRAPANAADQIRELAARGCPKTAIAKILGLNVFTLNRLMTEDETLRAAFEAGREKERHALHNMLYRQAMEHGNIAAAIFILKARHSYRDRGEILQTDGEEDYAADMSREDTVIIRPDEPVPDKPIL